MIKHYLDIFSVNEINKIVQLGDSLALKEASFGGGNLQHKTRNSKIAWIKPPEHATWLIPKISKIWKNEFYRRFEDLQYTVYGIGGHYDWHKDVIKKPKSIKLERVSVAVVQLSNSFEYEGGDLELDIGEKIISVEKKKGMITIFPIDMRHRVTTVTKGLRKSLIIWAVS